MSEGSGKKTLGRLKNGSLRVLRGSEHIVEAQFDEARLLGSLAIAFMLVGFLLVAQWRGTSVAADSLESQSDSDLALLIRELAVGNDALQSEALKLEISLSSAERDEAGRVELLDAAREQLRDVRTMAGLEAAVGQGVTIRLEDPQRVLLAQDVVAVVNELRSAGAEAISVGGLRVDALSGVTDSPEGIRVDSAAVGRSIEIVAIGNSGDLEQALLLPGGIRSTLIAYPGVSMSVIAGPGLEVPAAPARPYTLGVPEDDMD